MSRNHTKGPWKIYDANSDTMHVGTIPSDEQRGCNYEVVCNLFEDEADNYYPDNEFKLFSNAAANARLIAAAPELLENLIDAVRIAERDGMPDNPGSAPKWVSSARAAIAKAAEVK